MRQKIYQVDAFADRPFVGNPAAVCILPEPREEGWMQALAMEMNLSETAFLVRRDDGYNLRWFTPAVEVDLCGHATLASAHILWETETLAANETARFYSRSGPLTAVKNGDWITLDFPAEQQQPFEAPAGLLEALGTTARYIGKNRFDYLVEVESEELVRSLKPDFGVLAQIKARGVTVTSRATTAGYDFVSRNFDPAVGINEDPVTGSAHCYLGPYWQARLGKSDFIAYQASARGGTVRVGVRGDRVLLGGQAVTVLQGELL